MLVQWSNLPPSLATWEDTEALRQRFPRAPAWGQAGLRQGGDVSITKEAEPESPTNQEDKGAPERVTGSMDQTEPEPRKCSRVRRASVRFGGHEWA